jgi:SSS family solute:Na+ symporter
MDELLTNLSRMTGADLWVLFAIVGIMLLVGYLSSKDQATTQAFFLGGRSIPGWAACLSFVGTEVSAVTIVSVPAAAYMENCQYLQFFIGSAAARVTIAYLFIPAFYKYNCTTIYEFLRHRFGPGTHYAASALFFITRLLGSGVRLMAAAMAVSILLGWNMVNTIAFFIILGIFYIGYGGIKAIVWTNVVQTLTFIVGGLATLVFLYAHIDGGLRGVLSVAGAGGRLSVINWGPHWGEPGWLHRILSDPNIIYIAILNGFVGSMAAFGTDQEMMQRLLTLDTRQRSQRTMLGTMFWSLLVLVIYLCVGVGIYAFYGQHPGLPLPNNLDKIYPHFANQVMSPVMRGLVLSSVVMASIDSPLGSLTTSFVTDIYKTLVKPQASDRHYLFVSRVGVVVFGLALGAIAWAFSHLEKILWLAFKIGGVTYGSLLGVFLLGLLTKKKGGNKANLVAMISVACINLILLILSEKGVFPLGWSWLVIIGTAGTFLGSWALAPILDRTQE